VVMGVIAVMMASVLGGVTGEICRSRSPVGKFLAYVGDWLMRRVWPSGRLRGR
jgi:hypothetical protein